MTAPPSSLPDTDIGVSAFNSTTVVEAAYKQIKGEIQLLEAGIRVWKTRYNTLSIIARLPPEILSTIFKCIAAASQQWIASYNYRTRWINVTHVCSYWRRVALEDPSLWTNIPFSHPRWAKEMLERSKGASLTIVADLYAKNSSHMELVRSALTRISRIQKLSLTQNSNENLLETTLWGLVEPAPRLESLKVSFNDINSVHRLPLRIFSGEAPRLRELDLRDCALTWDAPFLRGLTSLKMSSIPLKARPSMSHILAALRNMPNLSTLVLRNILPESSLDAATGKLSPGLVARLPQLTHLCIESDVPEGAFLLDHLIYPLTVSITLVGTIKYESANGAEASCKVPVLRSFCKVLGTSQPVRCLSAHHVSYSSCVQLKTYDTPGTCLHPPRNPKVDFTLKFGQKYEPTSIKSCSDIHQALWTSIPMKDLESLQVIDYNRSEEWSHIFTILAPTKLKNLRVVGGTIPFLRALSPDAPAPQTGRAKRRIPLKLPCLRELAIESWIFDEMTDDGISCLKLLKICLEDRRKRRAAIKELFLNDCSHITSDDVKSLREIVKNVDWDGCENFSESGCECGLPFCDGDDCEDNSDYDFVLGLPW